MQRKKRAGSLTLEREDRPFGVWDPDHDDPMLDGNWVERVEAAATAAAEAGDDKEEHAA